MIILVNQQRDKLQSSLDENPVSNKFQDKNESTITSPYIYTHNWKPCVT